MRNNGIVTVFFGRDSPLGRIKRAERVSENLQESPLLLARPFPPESWDFPSTAGGVQPSGYAK